MKITEIHTDILRIPEDDPLADMPEDVNRLRPIVILRMQTDKRHRGHRPHLLWRRDDRLAAHRGR